MNLLLFKAAQHKVIKSSVEIDKDYLHFPGCAISVRKREQSDMGLFYGCAVHGIPKKNLNDKDVEWTVNGVNAKYFKNHFRIWPTNNMTDTVLYSYLRILNPIALRGPTEIKCSFGRSYSTFQMNSEN